MASKELIAQVEDILEAAFVQEDNFTVTTNAILSTILATLQEPTEGMRERGLWYSDDPEKAWHAMLARSPLGGQSE